MMLAVALSPTTVGGASAGSGEFAALRLWNLGGKLALDARRKTIDQHYDATPAASGETVEQIVDEQLTLTGHGAVYHPNLLSFDARLDLGLEQYSYRDPQDTSSSSGSLVGYAVAARVLRKKPYPLVLQASQDQRLDPRPFLPAVEHRAETQGLRWQWVSRESPIQLQWNRQRHQVESAFGGDPGRDTESERLRLDAAYRFSDSHDLSLLLGRDLRRELDASSDDVEERAELQHHLAFGPDFCHSMDAAVRYYDRQGTFVSDSLSADLAARLRLTNSVHSNISFTGTRYSAGTEPDEVDIDSVRTAGSVTHQLYRSLTSTAFGSWSRDDIAPDNREIRQREAGVAFLYRKRNPVGRLQVNYRLANRCTENRGGSIRLPRRETSGTFTAAGGPIVLTEEYILPDSIVVEAADGIGVTFREGIDYTVRVFGRRLEIDRLPGSLIADDQPLRLYYDLELPGDREATSLEQGLTIRHFFRAGFELWYDRSWTDEQLSAADPTLMPPVDTDRESVGAAWHGAGGWVRAEHSRDDSEVSYTSWQLQAGYSHRFRFRASAGVIGSWTADDFTEPIARSRDVAAGRLTWDQTLRPQLTLHGELGYRDERDTVFGNEDGIESDWSLRWRIRQTRVSLGWRWTTFEDEALDMDSSAVRLQIVREF